MGADFQFSGSCIFRTGSNARAAQYVPISSRPGDHCHSRENERVWIARLLWVGLGSGFLANCQWFVDPIIAPTSHFDSKTYVQWEPSNNTPSQVSDDGHDARKLARKRTVIANASGQEPAPPTNTAEVPTRQIPKPSGGTSLTSTPRSTSSDRLHVASSSISSNSSQSRHQARRGHRASSSNSADSREDDERSQSSSGKKMKRAHHRHHRHSTDSTGVSPLNSAYSPVRNATTNENPPSSTTFSGSSRHSRK
ncbi:unnamed protein product [Echinostoma caproni]|uniref:Serine/arginine repetitive matrix protein 2 n=1 Tax=Echinostoma caproni TaxID=27848 RepID=A0A183B0R3_9TREM|nr:unnamed protein product [Echinostoma caproni]